MATLPLLKGKDISLEEALEDDDNILHRLDYPQKQEEFWARLVTLKADIEAIVAFHLQATSCQAADEADWMFGSYNVCIPVCISPPSDHHVLILIPLLFKIGEENNPGNTDEKLRCEVATYIWIREQCPDVPIPTLYGFAFPDGPTFVEASCVPFYVRLCWRITRVVRAWLGFSQPCPYVILQQNNALPTGYMIISYVKSGRMLSDTWSNLLLQDTPKRRTLFKGLANIILSLNRSKLLRIGSLTLANTGIATLTNRPLTLRLQTLENEGIPTIPRASTYESVEPYILDLLQCHDNRIYHQPNAVHDLTDGQQQFAALTMMRSLLHHFARREFRNGPFVLTLTDLHPSNIFVDEEWNITSLIDLEWACALPVELQTPPYWLSGRSIDDIEHGEHLETIEKVVNEFCDAVQGQESASPRQKSTCDDLPISHAQIMRDCWKRGSFWYFQALHSPKGLLRVFNEHVQRRFCEEHCTQSVFDRVVSPYWCVGAEEFIRRKTDEKMEYHGRLKERFA